uniref:Alpha-D-phosphohexomutase alpha/beta/alpha domain-containing protein n=1 Tax=Heterosigma akashiwo TaxID=2829 RepID=A0A7S3UUC1_HETAK
MILGRNFFVTPSDSLAIVAAHANAIPFFRDQGGIKGVARSMPTSAAVDLVAKRYNLELFETPTGWKFFGSLMDSALLGGTKYGPFLCGEESFGTGSDHLREKDGLWAVLAWLQILALYNSDPVRNLVHVEDIVKNHWRTFGRNYYCRYDYEGVNAERAEAMMSSLVIHLPSLKETVHAGSRVTTADEFEYRDPVDGSITRKQGIRIIFEDGSRVVFRLSGTAGCGATVRLYLERYEGPTGGRLGLDTTRALGPLAAFALRVARVEDFLGRAEPDVVT